jgi:hypothetical protein
MHASAARITIKEPEFTENRSQRSGAMPSRDLIKPFVSKTAKVAGCAVRCTPAPETQ